MTEDDVQVDGALQTRMVGPIVRIWKYYEDLVASSRTLELCSMKLSMALLITLIALLAARDEKVQKDLRSE